MIGGVKATPLIVAIENDDLKLASYLLEKGAVPNVDTPAGPAIHYAVGKSVINDFFPSQVKDSLLELLLTFGADPILKQGKFDAMSWAKRTGNKTGLLKLKQFLGLPEEMTTSERVSLARETYNDNDVLAGLSKDKSKVVRRAVALNKTTPLDTLKNLINDDDERTSVEAIDNYFFRQKVEASLEDFFDELVIINWLNYVVDDIKEHTRFSSEPCVLRGLYAARYSSNEVVHKAIVKMAHVHSPVKVDLAIGLVTYLKENKWVSEDTASSISEVFN